LVQFDFSRQSLPIQGRAKKRFWESQGATALHFNKIILVNNISHLFFLKLPLGDLLLEIIYACA
jgi:hypothetical protein